MHSQFAFQNGLQQTTDAIDSFDAHATELFERAFRGKMTTVLRRFLRKPVQSLMSLADAFSAGCIVNRYHGGLRAVRLDQIVGSVEKPDEFDGQFHPIQPHIEKRWVSVATAMLRGYVLPPVELIQVGEAYFVQDGHHRISVARALGYEYLDAQVTVWEVAPCTAA